MLRAIVFGLLFNRTRRANPELFDATAALASIDACLAEYDA